jgi:hypothetical protein
MKATRGQSSPGCAYNLGNFMRTLAMLSSTSLSRWDRQFESGLLQQGVKNELRLLGTHVAFARPGS